MTNPFGLEGESFLPPMNPLTAAYTGGMRSSALERNVRNMLGMAGNAVREVNNVMPMPLRQPRIPEMAANIATPMVGRDLSPQSLVDIIRRTESGGNYQALNREKKGNTASGAYQYTDSTWNNYGGYSKALLAPQEIQDRRINEDIATRLLKFKGDPFKAIAAHYLPAAANDPSTWAQPYKLQSGNVAPVADYVRKVVAGTSLEESFNVYMAQFRR